MKMFRVTALLVMTFFVVFGSAQGVCGQADQERVILVLPESALVQGSQLILGEIGEISGPPELTALVAAINAGAAPGPGNTRRLTKGQIEVRMRQARLDLASIEFRGASTVQVSGMAGVGPTAVATEQGVPLYATVVAGRDLARGDILTAADLVVEEREHRGGPADSRPVEEFLGLRAKRLISAGTALGSTNVEAVPAVERGAPLMILVRTSALVVSAPGVARGSGAIGETIAVENTLSRQVVQGRIIDGETVEVNMRGSETP